MLASHIEAEIMDQYAMGTLPEISLSEIEEHLLICPVCQTRLQEADEFIALFRVAATEPDARPVAWWKTAFSFPTTAWAGAAAAVAVVVLMLVFGPVRHSTLPPAVVVMQALRGAESGSLVPAGRAATLVFNLPPSASPGQYQIQIVNTTGNGVLNAVAEARNGRLNATIGKLDRGAYWVRLYQMRPEWELVEEYALRAR